MFDISFSELLVIGVVALIVIGPERLPKVARTVGHLIGRAQRYVNDVKGDIQREIELEELRKMKQDMEAAARNLHDSFQKTADSVHDEIKDPLAQLEKDFAQVQEELAKASGQTGNPAATPGQNSDPTPENASPTAASVPPVTNSGQGSGVQQNNIPSSTENKS